MVKYVFHGGSVDPTTNTNDVLYKELVEDIPNNGTVLLVYFASRKNNYQDEIEYDSNECRKQSEGRDISIEIATEKDFLRQIESANAVYLRGGSTHKLIETLQQYPFLKPRLRNKTVAGSSAGAYALSTFYSSHYEDIAAKGLGIAPVRVVTHFKSRKMPPRPKAIEMLKNTAPELPLIILKEGEIEVITED